MEKLSRRSFTTDMLASLATFGLLKAAYAGDSFAQGIKPVTDKWLKGRAPSTPASGISSSSSTLTP